jgi:hypothetical protein
LIWVLSIAAMALRIILTVSPSAATSLSSARMAFFHAPFAVAVAATALRTFWMKDTA